MATTEFVVVIVFSMVLSYVGSIGLLSVVQGCNLFAGWLEHLVVASCKVCGGWVALNNVG
jgi:hypothetical protein